MLYLYSFLALCLNDRSPGLDFDVHVGQELNAGMIVFYKIFLLIKSRNGHGNGIPFSIPFRRNDYSPNGYTRRLLAYVHCDVPLPRISDPPLLIPGYSSACPHQTPGRERGGRL